MTVIRDTNVSADLEAKLGKNIWWKPDLDRKVLKAVSYTHLRAHET